MKLTTFIFFTLLFIFPTAAQTDSEDLNFFGQVRVRAELDGRDFNNETSPTIFTTMRTRFGVQKTFEKKVDVKVLLQDSRFFGEENGTKTPIDNVDLHEAYVKIRKPFDLPLSVQAGRFEMPYSTQRFIAKNNWNNVGQSFDGIRFQLPIGKETNIWAVSIRDRIIRGSSPSAPYIAPSDSSLGFYGFWSTFEPAAKQLFDLFAYYEIDNGKSNGIDDDLSRVTFGGVYRGKTGDWKPVLELAYQTGSLTTRGANMDVAAYFVSPQLYYMFSESQAGLGAAIFSGMEPGASEYNVFSNNLGAGHKYLGYMDYFSANVPGQTRGLGLIDAFLQYKWDPDGSPVSLQFDFHHFMSHQKDAADNSVFGQELDMTFKYKVLENTSIQWYSGVFLPGDLMKAFYNTPSGAREDPGFWSAILVIANF